jgi:tetratricopeptide (TPR) repeat protein
VGAAFIVFEILFLAMYSDSFWFSVDVTWLGIPTIFAALAIAHYALSFAESKRACRILSFLFKGRPPILYRHWLIAQDSESDAGLSFGLRHIIWSAIHEVDLTMLGNLVIKSYVLCGRSSKAEVILKIPFGVAAYETQDALLKLLKEKCPDVIINPRLLKRINTKEMKGAKWIPAIGATFLFLVLCDVGDSTFKYLEILKGFYLTQTTEKDPSPDAQLAHRFFNKSEVLLNNPIPFSWVTKKLLREGRGAANVYEAEADALFALGRKEEAIKATQQALSFSPKNFRINLKLARLFLLAHDQRKARQQIEQAIDNHKHSLLPGLYMVAFLSDYGKNPNQFWKSYEDDLDDDVFGDEPAWPPGGNRFLHDVWYREDLSFIVDKLVKTHQ